MRKEQVGRIGSTLESVVELTLIVLSTAVILLEETRLPVVEFAVKSLWFVVGALSIYRAWRRGLLSATPKEMFDKVRNEGRPARRPLELPAFWLGLVASMFVL
jgi:hypothetical protein